MKIITKITKCILNYISTIRKGNSSIDELAARFVLDGNVHAISLKWYDMNDYAYGVVIRKISGKYFITKWQHEYHDNDLVISQSTRCMSNHKSIVRFINSLSLEDAMIRIMDKHGKNVDWKIIFPESDYGTLPEYFKEIKKFVPPVVHKDNAEKRANLLAKMRRLPDPPQEIEV